MGDYLRPDDEVVEAYVLLRARVVDLVRSRGVADGDLPVPHCPGWTVRDLMAHVVGAPEDVLAGNVEGAATEAWTRAQVERHQGDSVHDLADLWEAMAGQFDAALPLIPAPVNSQIVMDAVTHEHDLRHALGAPGARQEPAVGVALGFHLHAADRGRPNVAEWLLALDVDEFDLLRVCSGRRSREQVAGLGIDVDLVERLLAGSPLSLPVDAIDE